MDNGFVYITHEYVGRLAVGLDVATAVNKDSEIIDGYAYLGIMQSSG